MGACPACCGTDKSAAIAELGGVQVPAPSYEVKGVEPVPSPGVGTVQEFALSSGGNVTNPGTTALRAVEYQAVHYDDGSSYTGELVGGRRQGHGLWQGLQGQYEGQWHDDIQHGQGRQTWNDGRVFNGQFDEGKFSGHGRMVWHTSKGLMSYEGTYCDDLKHGVGKFVWADGRAYDGEWMRGKRHGKGMYTNSKAEVRVGYWQNDQFERWDGSHAGMNPPTPPAWGGATPQGSPPGTAEALKASPFGSVPFASDHRVG